MNLIFTCGGTAGHINPAIAVANMMRERHPDCNILFIGAKGHMEEKLVPQAGYDLKCLEGSGLSRGKNLAAMKKNLHAVKCVREGVKACKKIFREFKPDVVIGTGGYASFPALYAAQSMGIPTCVHESNAVPGVTTRLAANKASRVLVAFEESVRHYKHPEKVEVVGMPVRREFIFDTKEEARKELGLSGFVVVSAFGSQGAKVMNETIADMMPLEQADGFPSTTSTPPAASARSGCLSASWITAWTGKTARRWISGSIFTTCPLSWRRRISSSVGRAAPPAMRSALPARPASSSRRPM